MHITKRKKNQGLLKKILRLCLVLFLVSSLSSCFDQGKKDTNSRSKATKSGKNKSKGLYNQLIVPGRPNVFAFFMEACPACRRTKPVFDKVSQNYKDFSVKKLIFEKDRELISNLGITSFPTIVFFNSLGEELKTIVGETDQQKLEEVFKEISTSESNQNTENIGDKEKEHQNSIRTTEK